MRTFLRHSCFILSALFITTLLPSVSFAQMFSVGEPERQAPRILRPYTVVGLSWEAAQFDYTGDEATSDQRVDFNDSIFRLRFESPGLELGLGFGGSLTGMDETSYVNVLGRLYNDFPLVRRPTFFLLLPIQLTTDLKRVHRGDTDAEFRQSSLTFGSGIASIFRLGDPIDIDLRATPNFGFSFSQGNLFGGSLFRFDGRARIFFRNLIGTNALVLGYHFDYRTYNIDGDLNDYDFVSHSVTLGIAF